MESKTGEYRVIGLSAPASFTFENRFGSWWAVSGLEKDRYKALFDWIKNDNGFWKDHHVWAFVEHSGLASDGTPMQGKVTDIKIIDIPRKYNLKR